MNQSQNGEDNQQQKIDIHNYNSPGYRPLTVKGGGLKIDFKRFLQEDEINEISIIKDST
jgi:hypothetical protein